MAGPLAGISAEQIVKQKLPDQAQNAQKNGPSKFDQSMKGGSTHGADAANKAQHAHAAQQVQQLDRTRGILERLGAIERFFDRGNGGCKRGRSRARISAQGVDDRLKATEWHQRLVALEIHDDQLVRPGKLFGHLGQAITPRGVRVARDSSLNTQAGRQIRNACVVCCDHNIGATQLACPFDHMCDQRLAGNWQQRLIGKPSRSKACWYRNDNALSHLHGPRLQQCHSGDSTKHNAQPDGWALWCSKGAWR